MDPDELALVNKAISAAGTTRGCCEWNERAAKRVRLSSPCEGLTPEGIRELLIEFVIHGGGITQVLEKRSEYRDRRRYYYKAILPLPNFTLGLFVELVLTDDDFDLPSVEIVNAHEQQR